MHGEAALQGYRKDLLVEKEVMAQVSGVTFKGSDVQPWLCKGVCACLKHKDLITGFIHFCEHVHDLVHRPSSSKQDQGEHLQGSGSDHVTFWLYKVPIVSPCTDVHEVEGAGGERLEPAYGLLGPHLLRVGYDKAVGVS